MRPLYATFKRQARRQLARAACFVYTSPVARFTNNISVFLFIRNKNARQIIGSQVGFTNYKLRNFVLLQLLQLQTLIS